MLTRGGGVLCENDGTGLSLQMRDIERSERIARRNDY